MTIWPEVDPKHARPTPFVVALVIMLLLAGVSLWTAFLGMGVFAPVVQFVIAGIQTFILYALFMRLKRARSLKWVFAVSGFFWLLFLYGLTMTDYGTRRGWPPTYVPSAGIFQSHQGGP